MMLCGMTQIQRIIIGIVSLLLCASGITQIIMPRIAVPPRLPPPSTVNSQFLKAGVHTRLAGVGDEKFISKQLDLVAQMGSPWIVELFPWAYAQPRSAYGYDWKGFDLVVAHAKQRGIRVIARLDFVPAWARPSTSSDRLLLPDAYDDYVNYVVAFVTRYAPQGIMHISIWNEPNLRFEWGGRPPDPEAYAALMATLYPAVKAVNPDVIIIAGNLSPGPSLGDNAEVRLSDREFTERYFAAGGWQHTDAWGVHAYGGQLPPDAPPDWGAVNFRRVELVRELISHYGKFPIYITESGWNDHQRWQLAITPAQRIRWTAQAYHMAEAWPWLESMVIWQFGLPAPTRTYQDGWLIVAGDGTPRAIFYELQNTLTAR
ncbi:MAG: hypothetical protein FJ040_02335 [Chloroflexi bacterium]|nr:hypothetical protein [Chloroflexota bacterium]